MPRKLETGGLRADLIAVKGLLDAATRRNDPVGIIQYKYRMNLLEEELRDLESTPECKASVALFFGGEPVLGSRGINTNFAGSILGKFQEIVSKRFAAAELGGLGERGPVPLSINTQLMITEIARGSFGFVLDELGDQQDTCNTFLKQIVDDVTLLVHHTAAEDEIEFEQAAENLDKRTLSALKEFFVTLDSSKATLRVVEDIHDFQLDRSAVNRGRVRTEATDIQEDSDDVIGELIGFLPEHKRFELRKATGEVISGPASKEATEKYLAALHSAEGAVGKTWKTKINIRTLQKLNQQPKSYYKLIDLVERLS